MDDRLTVASSTGASAWLLPPDPAGDESVMGFLKEWGVHQSNGASRSMFGKPTTPQPPQRQPQRRAAPPASYPSPFLQAKRATALPPPMDMPAAGVLARSTPLSRSPDVSLAAKKTFAPLRPVTNLDQTQRTVERVRAKNTPAATAPAAASLRLQQVPKQVVIVTQPSAVPQHSAPTAAAVAATRKRGRGERTASFAATVAPRMRKCPLVRLAPRDAEAERAITAVRRNPFVEIDLPKWRSLRDLIGEVRRNWSAAAPFAAGRPLRITFADDGSRVLTPRTTGLDPSLTCAQLFSVQGKDFATPLRLSYSWGVAPVAATLGAATVAAPVAPAAPAPCAALRRSPRINPALPPPSRRRIDAIEPLPAQGARDVRHS